LFKRDELLMSSRSVDKPVSIFCRLEKQRKKLHKENLLKDMKDEKDEKLEKV